MNGKDKSQLSSPDQEDRSTHIVSSLNRRSFIKYVGGIGALFLLSPLNPLLELLKSSAIQGEDRTETSETASESRFRWAMVNDQSTCIGCNFCTYACKAVNDTAPQIDWNYVFTGDFVIHSSEKHKVFIPRPCMHCENAPCTKVCPVKATYTRSDGIVMMDYEKCIGCRYCVVACPYSARYFNWKEFTEKNPYVPDWGHPEVPRRSVGVVEKCTFCVHRIDSGLKRGLMPGKDLTATPACVNICPTGARVFGDLNDPESKVSKLLDSRSWYHLLEELGAEPRVFYLPR